MFAHAGQRLVELAGVQRGQRVLDVASGRGAVLLPAAQAVGPTGEVVAIDLAPGMVEETSRAITELGLKQARIELTDAERLDFSSASFDAVLCSFAVFFLSDLEAALDGFARVLKPGGAVGFAFVRDADPRWEWYEDLLRERGAISAQPPTDRPSVRAPGVLVAKLHAFTDVREVCEKSELFYRDPEEWWASLWTHGSRRPLELLPPERLAQIKMECVERAAQQMTPRGLPERFSFVYVLGQK
jgi:SAM-dependent methyltransferase